MLNTNSDISVDSLSPEGSEDTVNPAASLLVSILFGALQVGGFFVQTMGVPASVAAMLQGAVLFFVVGGEFLTQYRFVISRKEVA